MSVVEIERGDGVMVIRMNRPERMNALGIELREALADGVVRVSRQPASWRWRSSPAPGAPSAPART